LIFYCPFYQRTFEVRPRLHVNVLFPYTIFTYPVTYWFTYSLCTVLLRMACCLPSIGQCTTWELRYKTLPTTSQTELNFSFAVTCPRCRGRHVFAYRYCLFVIGGSCFLAEILVVLVFLGQSFKNDDTHRSGRQLLAFYEPLVQGMLLNML
jgi:hypothetical protein